jgi:hypothetical protein
MYGPQGEELAVLYRLWESEVFSDDTWGGSFAILTPTIIPPSEGAYRLYLEDRREREVVVWTLSENAFGEFIGLDQAVPQPTHEVLVDETA